jgi:hypothetical protein
MAGAELKKSRNNAGLLGQIALGKRQELKKKILFKESTSE